MRETRQAIMSDVAALRDAPPDFKPNPKIVANNTVKYTRPDGAIVTRLHHTDIVVQHPNGELELNTGGWKTHTTKDRLRGFANVYSDRGVWYVAGEPFFDGIRIKDGKVTNANRKEVESTVRELVALKKRITKFVALLDTMKELPAPNAGDCWHCSMFDREKPRGEIKFNSHEDTHGGPGDASGHLLSHIEEGYMHGSLIMNALTWAGYGRPSIVFHMDDAACKRGESPNMVKRALRRYLQRKLGIG